MPAQNSAVETVTKHSSRSVAETVDRFRDILNGKGVQIFAVIDQRAAAREAELDLRETVLVVFGDPRAGTPVMAAVPMTALDLPLKVVVWDDGGQTEVTYESPASLAARHELSPELATRLAAIDPLTDALVIDG